MRIACPHCGDRPTPEFSYRGDASLHRPGPDDADPGSPAWMAYVYLRANRAGDHREYWLHSGGCRALMVIERDVTNHDVIAVTPAPGAAS